jgi:hypothetical protein
MILQQRKTKWRCELMSNEPEDKSEIKVEKITEAVTKFKNDLTVLTKDLQLDVDAWRFSVESQKEAVKVDVAFTLTIKKKTDNKE